MHRIRPLNEEFTMTDDSLAVARPITPHRRVSWLVGAPLCLLDALYLSHLAPPLSAERPETLVVWVLGIAALALLAWSLLCSACAHLALLRVAPPAARAAARFFVSRCGTRLSRSLLARAGASALIGSALVTGAPAAASLAAPQDQASPSVSRHGQIAPEPLPPTRRRHRRIRPRSPHPRRIHRPRMDPHTRPRSQ